MQNAFDDTMDRRRQRSPDFPLIRTQNRKDEREKIEREREKNNFELNYCASLKLNAVLHAPQSV